MSEKIFNKEASMAKLNKIKPTVWKRIDFSYNPLREYRNKSKFNIELEGNIESHKLDFEDMEYDNRFGLDLYQRELNKIYFNNALKLKVKKGKKEDKENKIKIKYSKDNKDIIEYNLIEVEENAQVDIIFDYENENTLEGIRNSYYKFKIAKGAVVNIVFFQRLALDSESFSAIILDIDEFATVKQYHINLGARINASSTKAYLGANSLSKLYSIYLLDQDRKLDLEYTSIHKGERSESLIEGRGILKDSAKKVFRGNLEFKKGSRKSKGKEEEFTLILNKDVKSHSIPTLFCDEDDVIGEHAASAGSIDENKLFYLKTRGLSSKDAIKLISVSSFKPILKEIASKNLIEDIEKSIEESL